MENTIDTWDYVDLQDGECFVGEGCLEDFITALREVESNIEAAGGTITKVFCDSDRDICLQYTRPKTKEELETERREAEERAQRDAKHNAARIQHLRECAAHYGLELVPKNT